MPALQDITGASATMRAAIFLSRHLSPKTAGHLIRFAANIIVLSRGSTYQAICRNQAQVRGLPLNDPSLKEAAREVLIHSSQGYYDLFRYTAMGKPVPVQLDDQELNYLLACLKKGKGAIAVAPHLSNFDFSMQHITLSQQLPAQVLTLSEPSPGFQLLNDLRANPYLEVTPISNSSLRMAIRRLRAGGLIGTGIDRPIPGQTEMVEFFDRPAPLPMGHIRLALKTGAPIVVIWCEWSLEAGYRIRIAPPVEMDPLQDPKTSVLYNTRRVLEVIEPAIARQPGQWVMFVPVWPDETPSQQHVH